jgi:hypothetical protein
MPSVIGQGNGWLESAAGFAVASQGLTRAETDGFLHFWGVKEEDREARALKWPHLREFKAGEKVYDLTDPKDFVAFQKDAADGCLDGKIGPKGGNVHVDNEGHVFVNGKPYDITKPEDVYKLQQDNKDGALDGKVSKDGIDKPGSSESISTPPANTAGAAPAQKPPTKPSSSDVPPTKAPDNEDIPDFSRMSWSQIIAYIRNLLAAKEDQAKVKMKDLAEKSKGLDENSDEKKELTAQIQDVTDLVKSIQEITTMLSVLQKDQHDLAMRLIQNIAG